MQSTTYEILALTMVPGLGGARLRSLLSAFSSPGELLHASRAQLRALRLTTEEQYYLIGGFARKDADHAVAEAERKGVSIFSIHDPCYPEQLKHIYDPPLVLYAKGSPSQLSNPAIAVVGARRCSVYGREVAYAMARDLAGLGLTITSGMALGIDSQAHLGAMAAPGSTTAVLGTGVDVVYPRSHHRIYDRIVGSGCVVSEFRLGTFAAAHNFPVRNRIISGLSLGTLIPEAAEFSGSLITARLTLEQGRELWAVPGNVTNPGSYGPNHLIRQGAKPVLCAQDVLEDLPLPVLQLLSATGRENGVPSPADSREEKILKILSSEKAVHFDFILEATGLNITDLSSLLVTLEASGRVRAYPGRRYSRILKPGFEAAQGRGPRNRV